MKQLILFLLLTINYKYSFAQDKKVNPKLTEDWSRKPETISFNKSSVPSDAIILFDGKNLDQWQKAGFENKPAGWKIKGNAMEIIPKSGSIATKKAFGNCQLHIEWKTPVKEVKEGCKGQKCGNSGIFIMGRYEVQILNSFENETYYNGMAGTIYKQHVPLVNPSLQAGKWQSYDIVFTAPIFNKDKTLKSPAYITILQNGVLIQNHVIIKGPTVFRGQPSYKFHSKKQPLKLQDHNNKVQYRNIWIREL